MLKKIMIVLLSLLSLGAMAQDKKEKAKSNQPNKSKDVSNEITTASGLKYKIIEAGKGRLVMPGDKVTVHYTGTLTNGTKFDSSRDKNDPFSFRVGGGQVIRGWDEGLALLHVGDKAILTLPPSIGYGSSKVGMIPENSTLIFDIEVLDAVASPKPQTPVPYDVAGKDTLTMQSGLKFIKVENGNGPHAINGQTVSVHYTGYLLDGKMFDSSIQRGEPISFQLGASRVIKGWDEAISYMQVGDKLRLIIPSHLGYGEAGAGGGIIPPNATLIFDVHLVEVK